MSTENTIDKVKLISELKDIHGELFKVYKKLFDFKYKHDEKVKLFIDNEYKENGVGSKEKKAWNDNFCHRASYTLLNKILFVRICEDKGFMRNVEDYIAGEVKDSHIGEKLSKIGLQKWSRLITNYTLGELIKFAFDDMKQSYSNIVLYKEDKYEILNPRDEEFSIKYIDGDKDTKDLVLDFENALINIIEKLDTNNFNFKYTDGNILGDVYEKFMDRETRKAIGQFYTPEFVIKYILKNTVEEADILENPFVTVADISCGSGHFLIMAYDILKEKFSNNIKMLKERYAEETYIIKKDGKEIQLSGREYWVKEHIHYHILKHCIYGSDIDSFAVQLTTINLLLKDLDNFTDELNIIECDSLIKWEEDYNWAHLDNELKEQFETIIINQTNLFGEEEKKEQRIQKQSYNVKYTNLRGIEKIDVLDRERAKEIFDLCKFWNEKFDYIIGNPPYITVGGKYAELLESSYEEYLNYKYRYSNYKINTYILFYERAINKLNNKGKVSFITPRAILDNYYFENFREFLLNNILVKSILEVKDKVFDSAETGGNAIMVLENTFLKEYEIKLIPIEDIKNFTNVDKIAFYNSIESFKKNPNYKFLLNEISKTDLLNKIKLQTLPLEEVCEIKNGVNTGNVADILLSQEKKDERYIPIIEGKDISRYSIKWGGLFICYDNELKQKIDISQLKTKQKKIDFALRNKEIFDRPKIVIRQTGDKLIADLDLDKMITRHSVHTIAVKEKFDISLYYILCLLNSELINFYYESIIPEKGKAFAEVKIVNLEQLPIRVSENIKINTISEYGTILKDLFRKKLDLGTSIYDILSDFDVNHLKEYMDAKAELEGKIEIYYEILNVLIYDLYNISFEDIKYIKEKSGIKLYNEYEKIYNKGSIDSFMDIFENSQVDLEKMLSYKEFYQNHVLNSMTLKEMADEYAYSSYAMAILRKKYSNSSRNQLEIYNLTEIILEIYKYLNILVKDFMKIESGFMKLNDIKDTINNEYSSFEKIIELIRLNEPTKKSEVVVKEALNTDAYTWNAYRKDKSQDKVSKTFVKYYDSNYYGLAEWSDEIHKQYFMDAIDEYTVNSLNEKKSKDILKLFKDLEVEDKKDYIDIIEDKIKRAFS